DRPHDRRLAGLHLAEQPDNRRLLSRELADPALLLRIRLGSQNDPTNSAPRAGQAFARQDGHASGPSSAACVMPTLFTAPILPVRIRTQERCQTPFLPKTVSDTIFRDVMLATSMRCSSARRRRFASSSQCGQRA